MTQWARLLSVIICTAGIIELVIFYTYMSDVNMSQPGVSARHPGVGVVREDCPQRNVSRHITAVNMTIAAGHVFPSGLRPVLPWMSPSLEEAKTHTEAEKIYFSYVGTVQVQCMYSRRLGRKSDGGWNMCLVPPYSPHTNNCIVYSIGIGKYWSYDDANVQIFGCDVHSYDPTIKLKEHRRGEHIYFHPVGLYDQHTNLTMFNQSIVVNTLANLVMQNGHQGRIIDMVKFDIELSEWSVIPNMVKSGQLKYVKQIAFESHTCPYKSPGAAVSVKRYQYFMDILEQLQKAGFRRWRTHPNPDTGFIGSSGKRYFTCHEVYYININFLEKV